MTIGGGGGGGWQRCTIYIILSGQESGTSPLPAGHAARIGPIPPLANAAVVKPCKDPQKEGTLFGLKCVSEERTEQEGNSGPH